MGDIQYAEYDTKLEKLLSSLSSEQRILFEDWQAANLYLNSLVAIENRRIGFEEGLKTAMEMFNSDPE